MPEQIEDKINELVKAVSASREASERKCKETEENATKAAAKLAEGLQNLTTEQKETVKLVKEMEDSLDKAVTKMAKRSDKIGENTVSEAAKEYGNIFSDYISGRFAKGADPFADKEALTKSVISELVVKYGYEFNDHYKETRIKNMLEGTGPSGGYVVPPQLMDKIITRVWETTPLRNYATVLTTTSNQAEFIIDDMLAEGGWENETYIGKETGTPDLGRRFIKVHTLWAYPRMSKAVIEDASINLPEWIVRKVSKRFSLSENKAFASGTGNLEPVGFQTYPDYTAAEKADGNGAYGRGAIERIKSGAASDITADGIKRLQNSLKEAYQGNAIWGIRRKSFENVITLKDQQGRYIFDTRFLQEERTLALLGRPVVFMNDMPDVGAGALSMVYGDFAEGYTIIDRLGIEVLVDPYTAGNHMRYQCRKRVGGDVTNFEALKLMEISA